MPEDEHGTQQENSIAKSKQDSDSDQNPSDDAAINDALPSEVIDAIEELPPKERKIMQSMFMATASISGSPSSALAKRVTPEHITQTLENNNLERERQFIKRPIRRND